MAQILELFFNRQKSASCFETVCFKPSQASEIKSGELFLFGEIRN
ncbi:MAG: hypothetical protein NTV62_00865 [Candidatus Gribaldobacteria bacterium]|nr:hypothetical protein [Candidatus Gribaldobacteria bacterium]